MMKSLLVVFASLTVLSSSALSIGHDEVSSQRHLSLTRVNPPNQAMEMKKRTPAKEDSVSPAEDTIKLKPYYHRPAGAFYAPYVAVNGSGFYGYGSIKYIFVKPYSDYTYRAEDLGNYFYYWQYDSLGNDVFATEQECTISYDLLEKDPPKLCFAKGKEEGDTIFYYQYPAYYSDFSSGEDVWGDNPIVYPQDDGPQLLVVPDVSTEWDNNGKHTEFMLSSKTMTEGVQNGLHVNYLLSIYGVDPYGSNKYGWWFGKNGGHVDGIAQAFEKPEQPYMLKKVFLQNKLDMRVKDNVTMTCRVYKLDEIPAYNDSVCVKLPEEPGEIIAYGEALVTPQTAEDKNALVEFTLFNYDEDNPELTYDYTPTIDFPILVCIDGYNDPEMENLEEFSAFMSTNYYADEGYGELAYIKCPIYEEEFDEEGNALIDELGEPVTSFTGEYYWCGLNNFFESQRVMKTGLTIFISTEMPYLLFESPDEIGEYIFGNEGGEMQRQVGEDTIRGIQFLACIPSEDGDWQLSCNGDEVPEWLDIELVDGKDDDAFNNHVTALVTAEPLPHGVAYREAVVRFSIPGAHQDYKFIQGEKIGPIIPCLNDDGELNIADLNRMINFLFEDMYDNCMDLNSDGEFNIADINILIDLILRK